ncbi:beta-propeller fold lactonase family protein [Mycobacterium sp. NPDC051804]|uniref:beta-propeller fold lactonase family protein n=1 Tax=Mycobacterium sp. NPDC051804 TaxID=3364295 RepID=UPI0037ABD82C
MSLVAGFFQYLRVGKHPIPSKLFGSNTHVASVAVQSRGLGGSVMGYAQYVGRVGALAVALGIATAIASGPAVAWAEDGDSSSQQDNSDTNGIDTKPESFPTSASAPGSTTDGKVPDFGRVIQRNVQRAADDVRKTLTGIVRSSGGAHTSTHGPHSAGNENDTAPGAAEEETRSTDPALSSDPQLNVQQQNPSTDSPAEAGSASQFTSGQSAQNRRQQATSNTPAPSMTRVAQQFTETTYTAFTQIQHTVDDATVALRHNTQQFSAMLTPSPTSSDLRNAARFSITNNDPVYQQVAAAPQPRPVVRIVSGLLAAVGLNPGATNTPAAPISGATLLGGLDLIRREIEQSMLDMTPALASTTTSLELDPGDDSTFLAAPMAASTPIAAAAAAANPTVATVPVGEGPRGVAVSPDGSRAYVTHPDAGTVSVINTTTNTVIGQPIPVGQISNPGPGSIAVSPDGKRVYVSTSNGTNGSPTVTVMSAENDTYTVVSTIPVGAGAPGLSPSIALSPDGRRLYATSKHAAAVPSGTIVVGTLTVINTDNNTIVGSPIPITSPPGSFYPQAGAPTSVAVSPDGTRVYVANNVGGGTSVTVINAENDANTVVGSPIPVSVGAFGIAVSPDGSRVYVTNDDSYTGAVTVINTATNTVVGGPIPVGSLPQGVAVSPDGSRVYVVNNIDGTVSVINTTTNAVIGQPIAVGLAPSNIAVSPDGRRLYVVNQTDGTVSVIDTDVANSGGGGNTGGSPSDIDWESIENTLENFAFTVGFIPGVGSVVSGISLVIDVAQFATTLPPLISGDSEDFFDEIGDIAEDVIGLAPVVGRTAGKLIREVVPEVAEFGSKVVGVVGNAVTNVVGRGVDTVIDGIDNIIDGGGNVRWPW